MVGMGSGVACAVSVSSENVTPLCIRGGQSLVGTFGSSALSPTGSVCGVGCWPQPWSIHMLCLAGA